MISAPAPDAAVAYHYGTPSREGREFAAGRALVDLASEVVTITGPDRRTWLHAITSQALATLAAGISTEALIMSPHGHVEQAFGVIDDGTTTWLITDPERAAGLMKYLETMRFATRVEIAVRDDVRVIAANTQEHPLAASALAVWQDPWPMTTGTTYGPTDDEHPAAGTWNVSLAVVPKDLEVTGERAGIWAFEAARIEAWRPRLAREVDARTLPHELDWLRTAVHLNKGCYRGQETVARVINLGRPPRRLVFIHLDGTADELPEPGSEIIVGGRVVGRVTSSARHYELGPIALGVVKRNTAAHGDAEITGQGGPIAAKLEEIVTAAGTSAATPAQRPGADIRRAGGLSPR